MWSRGGGGMHGEGGMLGKEGMHGKGVCMVGGACVEEGECAWQGGMWHVWQGRTCMQERRPLKLAVCILLECILVEKCRKISKN